jgi:hypothetical protein
MGTHLAFDPTEDEIDFATVDLVVDTIFAYPVQAWPPRLHLINPFTWEPGPDPEPPAEDYRRSLTPDQYGEVWVPSQIGGSEMMPIKVEEDPDVDDERAGKGESGVMDRLESVSMNAREGDDGDMESGKSHAISKKRKMDDRSSLDSDENDIIVLPTPLSLVAATPDLPSDKPDTQDPWALVVRKQILEKAVGMSKVSATDKKMMKRSNCIPLCSC